MFTCREHWHSTGRCLTTPCPITRLGFASEEVCRWLCATNEACRSFTHNRYGHCFLQAAPANAAHVWAAEDKHQHYDTVLCVKIRGDMRQWVDHTKLAGAYRLGDLIMCSDGAMLLGSQPGFRPKGGGFEWCATLDHVNVRRRFPGSIGERYLKAARQSKDMGALVGAVESKLQDVRKSGECGAPEAYTPPSSGTCVFHVRLGEIFGMTDRSAADLWHGDKRGDAYRGTTNKPNKENNLGERYIQPRSFFERALRHMPNGTTRAVLVGNAASLVPRGGTTYGAGGAGKSLAYLQLLRKFLATKGVTVEVYNGSRLRSHHGVDCDYLYMAQASCFLRTGGSFGTSVAAVVRRRGGQVLSGATINDSYSGDWYGFGEPMG